MKHMINAKWFPAMDVLLKRHLRAIGNITISILNIIRNTYTCLKIARVTFEKQQLFCSNRIDFSNVHIHAYGCKVEVISYNVHEHSIGTFAIA